MPCGGNNINCQVLVMMMAKTDVNFMLKVHQKNVHVVHLMQWITTATVEIKLQIFFFFKGQTLTLGKCTTASYHFSNHHSCKCQNNTNEPGKSL